MNRGTTSRVGACRIGLSARRPVLALALAVALAGPALGDVIELTDGRKINGSISYSGNIVTLKDIDGTVVDTTRDKIKSVKLTSSQTPDEQAAAEWTRIGAQIRQSDDLGAIIKLHQDFLAKFPKAALAKDVTDSLGVYQELAKNDPVKFRGRWMARAQVEVTIKKWADDARPALDLYHAGKMKEALDAVKAILLDDKENPDAMTIGGLAAYRSNILPQAKTYFTNLAAIDPSNVMAENNLAVICFQQKAQPEALLDYTKGLQIKPDNRLLLDNIAEALNAFTGDKNGTPYKALQRQYDQAEARLETAMAKMGLHRWGGGWVNQQQLDQLTQRQKTLQDQLAQLNVQGRTAQQQYAGIDNQIQQAQQNAEIAVANVSLYNTQIITAQSRLQDTSVLIATRNLAAEDASRYGQQISALQQQKAQLEATMQAAAMQIEQIKAQLGNGSQAMYTGLQRMMELGEGDNPPPPAPVSVASDMPAPLLPVIIAPAPVMPSAPVVVPVPVPTQVIIVPGGGGGFGGGGNGGNGGGGRGGNNSGGGSGGAGNGRTGGSGATGSSSGGLPIPNNQPQLVPSNQPLPLPSSQAQPFPVNQGQPLPTSQGLVPRSQ